VFKNIKFFFFGIFQKTLKILPASYACLLSNIRQIIMGREIRFFYLKNHNLFKVESDHLIMFFNDKTRGFNTYSYGIKERALSLADTYCLNLVKFSNDDVFIDCGANYGDLYAWTLVNKIKVNYISFEPSPEEYECIKLNCNGQINNNLALSNKTGVSDFYLKSSSGDSSIIEPAEGFTKKIIIKTITLEDYVVKNNIKKIKFFKLEAEGFEPEISQGAKNILDRIEYIGVDGSPERGLKSEATIQQVTEFLENNNFKMIGSNINKFYSKALFKNKNIKTKNI